MTTKDTKAQKVTNSFPWEKGKNFQKYWGTELQKGAFPFDILPRLPNYGWKIKSSFRNKSIQNSFH
jgi:hypothetical protein